MISKYLEPHQRFQLIQVNKWFQQITKKNRLNYTMVFFVFPNPSDDKIFYEGQEEILNKFLKRYKALLPWINSNNIELKFLTVEELLKLCHNSSNFMINMLILNDHWANITHEQFKVILNSLKLSILSLENHKPIISNDSPEMCSETSSIHSGFLETCSKCPSLQYLQAKNFALLSKLNLEETHFKNIIFNNMYSNVSAFICMPLCLKKFHLNLDLQVCNDQADIIVFKMNQCQYIKEL
jgi:hypothetical protein